MPCRAQLGRRASAIVAEPPALWITDDVLATAWDRYARRCAPRKHARYTSNAPGPLEARRRSAKRRIGSAGVLSDGVGVGAVFDLGQLFGLRSAVPEYEKGWRWEAPAKPSVPAPRHRWAQPFSALSWLIPEPLKSKWERSVELLQVTPNESRARSREGFETLLSSCRDTPCLLDSDLAPLLRFLQGPHEDPAAENTALLLSWLQGRQITDTSYLSVATMITDKLALGTLSDHEFVSALRTLSPQPCSKKAVRKVFVSFWKAFCAKYSIADHRLTESQMQAQELVRDALIDATFTVETLIPRRDVVTRILNALAVDQSTTHDDHRRALLVGHIQRMCKLPTSEVTATRQNRLRAALMAVQHDSAPAVFSQVTASLSAVEPDAALGPKPAIIRNELSFWLWCLRTSPVTADQPASHRLWQAVYSALAKRFHIFDLAEHFSQHRADHLPEALLRFWLTSLLPAKSQSFEETETLDQRVYVQRRIARTIHHDEITALGNEFQSEWHKMESSSTRQDASPEVLAMRSTIRSLTLALRLVASKRLPYTSLMATILTTATRFSRFYVSLPRALILNFSNSKLGIPQTLATKYINHYLSLNKPRHALSILRRVPSLPLSPFLPALPLALAKNRSIHADHIFDLLERRVPADTIPAEFRHGSSRLIYTEAYITTIHELATHWAPDPRLTNRTAFRRVWECFRYLRDRGAPLETSLSRAMVKAGITRPLSEGDWVNTRQAQYILSIVRQIEGEEVAGDLDRLVFHLRAEMGQKALQRRRLGLSSRSRNGGLGTTWRQSVEYKFKIWARKKGVGEVETRERRKDVPRIVDERRRVDSLSTLGL